MANIRICRPDVGTELEPVEDLQQLISDCLLQEEEIAGKVVRGAQLTEQDVGRVCFSKVVFENCRFLQCRFKRAEFTDVVFKSCDFSNSFFTDATLCRCEFQNCKGAGMEMRGCQLMQTVFSNGNFTYACFNAVSFDRVLLEQSDFSECMLTECKLKFTRFIESRFSKANFFKTSLRGMDLTSCRIDSLHVSAEATELKGAVVDMFQAADIARLLGVIISG